MGFTEFEAPTNRGYCRPWVLSAYATSCPCPVGIAVNGQRDPLALRGIGPVICFADRDELAVPTVAAADSCLGLVFEAMFAAPQSVIEEKPAARFFAFFGGGEIAR
jgi:hypothetical protein